MTSISRSTRLFASLSLAFGLGLCLPACDSGEKKEEEKKEEKKDETIACTEHAKDLKGLEGDAEVECMCASDAGKGSVWGTNIYTTDSDICGAAVHVGLLEKGKDGKVKVKAAAGCDAYQGSEANGVTTSKWGKYEASFYFPAKGDGKCFEPPKDMCAANFKAIPDQTDDMQVECTCPAETPAGSIYGTGIYTTDSSICRAAVHSGALAEGKGGKVTVKKAAGCEKYEGTEANGLTSTSWAKYEASFYFVGKGEGKCAE